MSRETENRMRELFENEAADELAPGFDKAALWTRIEPRVRRRILSRIALPWLSHVAAVAAGLLLAWALLPRGGQAGEERAARVAAHGVSMLLRASPAPTAPPAPAEKVAAEMNAQEAETRVKKVSRRGVQEASLQTKSPMALPRKRSEENEPARIAVDRDLPTVLTPRTVPMQEGSTPKISAAAKQPAPVVVHLLDVSGESSERLRKPVEPLPMRRMGFFARLLSRNKVPDLTGAAAADAMVQRTYLSR